MHQFTMAKVLVVLAAMLSQVLSAVLPALSLTNIQPATFYGDVNGQIFDINGTVQEVVAELKNRYPDFELSHLTEPAVETRETSNKELPPDCLPVGNWHWEPAYVPAINDGISYLTKLNSAINIGAHACSRISCSENAGIFLCNDNDNAIQPHSPYLASYAADIVKDCAGQGVADHNTKFVGGQEFDTDRYNIVVRNSAC